MNISDCGRYPCVKGAVGSRLTDGSLPFILAQFFGRARSPSSVPGCARSTFPGGEGCLPVEAWDTGRSGMMRGFFSLIRPGLRPVHLPRGGRLPPAGAWDTGRSGRVGGFFPSSVRASPCHLPRRGRHPPAGEGLSPAGKGILPAGDEITVRCRRRTGPACRGPRGRRRRARGGR